MEIPPYILGLWLGDKYWWSSSIGLTNKDINLIKEFRNFLKDIGFKDERIKLSVYTKNGMSAEKEKLSAELGIPLRNIKEYKYKKGKETYLIIYVNSRGLKRKFEEMSRKINEFITSKDSLFQYMVGRFDSDGYYYPKGKEIRIAYTTRKEAENDALSVEKIFNLKPRVKFEKYANTWNLELKGKKWLFLINTILNLSKRATFLQSHRQLVP